MTDMSNWHILVVEDEPDGQVVVAGLLNYFGIQINAVSSAEEALSALKALDYDGIVIDLALPGMDGVTLIREIRSNPKTAHLPCIAITAYHTSYVKQQAIDAGFNAYFPKPIDDTSFVRELSRVIVDG